MKIWEFSRECEVRMEDGVGGREEFYRRGFCGRNVICVEMEGYLSQGWFFK